MDINKAFKYDQDDCVQFAPSVLQAFKNIDLDINHIQIATSVLIGLNSFKEKQQVCVIGAG